MLNVRERSFRKKYFGSNKNQNGIGENLTAKI